MKINNKYKLMKSLLRIIFKTLALITLLSIQICLIKYEHTINFNILLILYNYILFNNIAPCISAILLLMMDTISFLMTGYFGFITIFITIFSILALKYDNHFYNKLIMPILSIILFSVIQNILLYYALGYTNCVADLITSSLLNGGALILLWIITKQPIHK